MTNGEFVRKVIFVLIVLSLTGARALAQDISIGLKKPIALIQTDSTASNEAWIEISGLETSPLTANDLKITRGNQEAEILSIDSIESIFPSSLALSFVLDNSGSMFHAFDSLTRYCDTILDSLPKGVIAQAVAFDRSYRSRSHRYTERKSTFLAQRYFTSRKDSLEQFWHFFDTIRTQYTPLYDAIAAAVTNINARRMNGVDRNDVLLVVTDGQDNASRATVSDIAELLASERLKLFAINFRVEDEGRLPWLARHAGGEYYLANDLSELRRTLQDIGHRLTGQYHIRYRFPTLGPSSGR